MFLKGQRSSDSIVQKITCDFPNFLLYMIFYIKNILFVIDIKYFIDMINARCYPVSPTPG